MKYTDVTFSEWNDLPPSKIGLFKIWNNGRTACWHKKDGVLHRLDGPAIMKSSGVRVYYIDGEFLDIEAFIKKLSKIQLRQFFLNSENF